MMASAQDKGQIPAECFAKKGSNCVNAVITKIMYCDESRTNHHPMCIGGNDLATVTIGSPTPLQALCSKVGGLHTKPLAFCSLLCKPCNSSFVRDMANPHFHMVGLSVIIHLDWAKATPLPDPDSLHSACKLFALTSTMVTDLRQLPVTQVHRPTSRQSYTWMMLIYYILPPQLQHHQRSSLHTPRSPQPLGVAWPLPQVLPLNRKNAMLISWFTSSPGVEQPWVTLEHSPHLPHSSHRSTAPLSHHILLYPSQMD